MIRLCFSLSDISLIPSVMIWGGNCCCCETHTHKPVHLDVDECAKDNGACDSKRTCTNTAGSSKCEDCAAGYTNDGAKGCKGVCVCVCVCALMSVN